MVDEIKTEDTKTILDEAVKVAERQEKANAELKALLDRQEQMLAKRILGGRSEAGYVEKPVDPAIAEKERINKLIKFTGRQI
jgi:hypothetical protein